MNFHQHRTNYDHVKKAIGLKQTGHEYYQSTVVAAVVGMLSKRTAHVTVMQGVSEWHWIDHGRPYFILEPSLIPTFSRCRMDIPVDLIQFPYGLHSFSVHLPSAQDGNPLVIDDRHYVKSFLVTRVTESSMAYLQNKLLGPLPLDLGIGKYRNRLFLWVDVGEVDANGLPVYTYRQLVWNESCTVDEAMNALPDDPTINEGVIVPAEISKQCMRLVLSVCFLAGSNDPLVQPDVLAEHRPLLSTADPEQIKLLQEKAKKKGKYGWTIGTTAPPPASIGPRLYHEGRELEYAHIRQGHWHTTRYGPGKSLWRVQWYRLTTVRPDLPLRLS
jgi:hypothetical protein